MHQHSGIKDMGSLGTPGSRLRNPAIAAVLHEINWAETKGSGIRTMRRLAADAGLPLPEFASDRQKNEFKITLFLHPLRGEELANLLGKDLKYLRNQHLSALIQTGTLVFLYPESPNHKLQAYQLPENKQHAAD